jgi:hypothetical protein
MSQFVRKLRDVLAIKFLICLMLGFYVSLLPIPVNAKEVRRVTLDKRTYYVDVVSQGCRATVWLRVKPNMCSFGDIGPMELQARNTTLSDASRLICRAKATYNAGKTIVGCTASIASGACAAGALPSGGTTVAFCSTVFVYTANKGLADCIDGISNLIAGYLGIQREWAAVATMAKINSGQWISAIDKAIDTACADLRRSR